MSKLKLGMMCMWTIGTRAAGSTLRDAKNNDRRHRSWDITYHIDARLFTFTLEQMCHLFATNDAAEVLSVLFVGGGE